MRRLFFGNIFKNVSVSVVAFIAVVLIIREIRKMRSKFTSRQVHDPIVRMALNYYSLMFPHGSDWWSRNIEDVLHTVDKETMFRYGRETSDFESVSSEYKNIYDRDLTKDIQSALGTDWPDFLKIISGKEDEVIPKILPDNGDTTKLETFASNLYNDLNKGFWSANDVDLYKTMLLLNAEEFIALNNTFNQLYSKTEFEGKTLRTLIDEEYCTTSPSFCTAKSKLEARYKELNLM